MAYEVELPKDTEQLEAVVNNLVEVGEQDRSVKEVHWWYIHHYLHGARKFAGADFTNGTLDVDYANEDGLIQFRYEDVVSKFQAQVGRMLQMDLNPRVRRKSIGLEDMRNATLANIALRAAMPPSKVKRMHMAACPPFLKYGCVGFAVWNDQEQVGIDLVMPWELVPVPSRPLESSEERGLARVRWVPKEWVKGLPYVGRSVKWTGMEEMEMPAGELPDDASGRFATFGGSGSTGNARLEKHWRGGAGAKKDKTKVPVVRFVELWTWTQDGYVKEYVVMAGGKLVYRKEYTDVRMPMPLRVAVDIPTGGFYGRGFLSTVIPMNAEMEYSLGRLFTNVQDFDTYGLLCLPTTLGIPPEVIRSSDGTKRIVYAPDYTVPDLKPFNIEPANAGTLPAETIKLGAELNNRIANQPTEMLGGGAPGRVDSQSGLGFLYEVSNTPLTPSVISLAAAISGCYEAILALLPTIWGPEKAVEVAVLDDAMAGVQLDPSTGTVSLNTGLNSLPHPDTVDISVESMMPRSKEQEKVELQNALAQGIIDVTEYRIEVRKRDLGLPVGSEAEWQNWRRAVMNNIILFGDGQTPGQVEVNDHDLHEIHIRVITAFMARPEFYAASPQVRQKFTDLLLARQDRLAGFPEQLPYPEEGAIEQEAMNRMNPGMGPGVM